MTDKQWKDMLKMLLEILKNEEKEKATSPSLSFFIQFAFFYKTRYNLLILPLLGA